MPKFKQFQMPKIIQGIQINVTFVAISKKDACKILDVSMYAINNYCLIYEPKDDCCIRNKYQRFAHFNGGELSYAKPEWRNKVMPYNEIENYIARLRKTCKTYRQTIEMFNHHLKAD